MEIICQKQWQFLKKSIELEKISHAYLFLGQKGLGKKSTAIEFIKLLNCSDKIFSNRPCQICRSCQDIEKQIHPDFALVEPEKGQIQISQIRELKKILSLHAYSARYKSIIINNAETMNQEASSALLKILEEPKGETVFILVSNYSEALLSTIFSRCQTIKFFTLKPQKLSDENERVKEIISLAKSDLAFRFQYVKKIVEDNENIEEILSIWLIYFRDLLIKTVNGEQNNYSLLKLKNILKFIEQTKFLVSSTNVNKKLALETLMLEF